MRQTLKNSATAPSVLNEGARRPSRGSSLRILTGILILSTGASAQTMIPVAAKLPEPERLYNVQPPIVTKAGKTYAEWIRSSVDGVIHRAAERTISPAERNVDTTPIDITGPP